jgi:predicted N-formylglutamate amidohydrolase
MTAAPVDEESFASRVYGDPSTATGPFIFTCEHASHTVPWDTTHLDQSLLEQHWGWDIGAAQVVESLCDQSDSVAVLAGVSRLVIDVNRAPDSRTLVVKNCGDRPVDFNQNVDAHEIARRVNAVHTPFHQLVETVVDTRLRQCPVNLVSIHSFTPVWNGVPRAMEIGVLFDRYAEHAQRLAEALQSEGFITAMNAPYSGMTGELMYSANRHGLKYARPYLELEIRQDLIESPAGIERVSDKIARALSVFHP